MVFKGEVDGSALHMHVDIETKLKIEGHTRCMTILLHWLHL